jgi:hypothetical protein
MGLLMYHNDCRTAGQRCRFTKNFTATLRGNNVDMPLLRCAYEQGELQLMPAESKVNKGRLDGAKAWYVETRWYGFADGIVLKAWAGYAPTFDD